MVDHDNSYKLLFSNPSMIADLLKGFIREDQVDKLDFQSLEKVNGSYVSDDLRGREDDVVWKVRWGEKWLYVYLLLEFQSTVDRWMPVRIMTYVGLLYQDLINSKNLCDDKMLPPVLPIVLYNGDKKWTAATNISQLVHEISGGLSRYCPSLEYFLISEREYSDNELDDGKNLVAALFRLENSRDTQQLLEVVTSLLQWLVEPAHYSLKRAFTVWFRRVVFTDDADKLVIEELDEVKTMLADRVKEWNKGSMQKGLQKGLEQGVRKGAAQILVHQLKKKFGEISPELVLSIDTADEQQIIRWSEDVLTANKLSDIFAN